MSDPAWYEYVLVALFGSSTWLSVNAVWMSMPLLITDLPEKWNLPSYLALLVQFACIAPMIYGVLRRKIKKVKEANQAPFIIFLLIASAFLMLALAFTWHYVTFKHSTTLLSIFFLISAISTTTNVAYLPHLATMRHQLITPFFSGMGLSALFPSIISLIQGVGQSECVEINTDNQTQLKEKIEQPKFTVTVYFLIMFVWLIIAAAAFILLNYIVVRHKKREASETTQPLTSIAPNNNNRQIGYNSPYNTLDNNESESMLFRPTQTPPLVQDAYKINTCLYLFILLDTAFVCAQQNAVMPSIMIYSTLPYGTITYHLSLTLSNIANPLACMLPLCFNVPSYSTAKVFIPITGAIIACVAYLFLLAAQSPNPVFINTGFGPVITMAVCIILSALLSYTRTALAQILRDDCSDNDEKKNEQRLFWCGVATQGGSFIGGITIFPIISVFHIFKMAQPCQNIDTLNI